MEAKRRPAVPAAPLQHLSYASEARHDVTDPVVPEVAALREADSFEAAVAATAVLLDVTSPGGAAIGDRALEIVGAINVDLLTSHRYRTQFAWVLLSTSRYVGAWTRLVAAGGASESSTRLANAERLVGQHLTGLALQLCGRLDDSDPQARAMHYQLLGWCAQPATVCLGPLMRAADGEPDCLARACAAESIFVALARLLPADDAAASAWLESAIRTGSRETLLRIRHGLSWLAFRDLESSGERLLGGLASLASGDTPPLWPVELI